MPERKSLQTKLLSFHFIFSLLVCMAVGLVWLEMGQAAPKKPNPAPARNTAKKPTPQRKKSPAPPSRGKRATRLPMKTNVTKTVSRPNSSSPQKVVMPRPQSMQWVRYAPAWIRTVRVAKDANSPSLGTLSALAVENNYLLLPLDFVTDAWLAQSGVRFFIDGTTQEARLIDLSLTANFALLKTSQALRPSVLRHQFSFEPPATGSPLVVVSSKDFARPGARFVEAKQFGNTTYYRVQIEADKKPSSHFLFDRSGRLVAAASTGKETKDVWAGSTLALWELINRQSGPRPASAPSGLEERKRQLQLLQETWTRTIVPSPQTLAFGAMDCQHHLIKIQNLELAAQLNRVNAQICRSPFPVHLGPGYTAGVEILSGEFSSKTPLSSTQIENHLIEAVSSTSFKDLEEKSTIVNLMTTADCQKSKVGNNSGTPVIVRYCTSALKNESGLNDTVVSVVSAEPGTRTQFGVARIKGFNQVNTKRFISSLVETIRSVK